jgi:photosystem II stability/assembly factor-like uncharacterized protein
MKEPKAIEHVTSATVIRGKLSLARFFVALGIVMAASVGAYLQRPRPDPLAPPTWAESLLAPIEWNAFARVPTVQGRLNDVTVVADTDEIWVVGDDGLILHSADDGLTWQGVPLEAGPSAAQQVPEQRPPGVPSAPVLLDSNDVRRTQQPENQASPAANGSTKPNPGQQDASNPKQDPVAAQQAPEPSEPTLEPGDGGPPDLFAVHFADRTHGFIASRAPLAVFVTSDGGSTWRRSPPIELRGRRLRVDHFEFADASNGWLLGLGDALLRTRDGGETWAVIPLPKVAKWTGLFLDPAHGLLSGDADLFAVVGDDASLEELGALEASAVDLAASPSGSMFAFGIDGKVYESRNHRSPWERTDVGNTVASVLAVMQDHQLGALRFSDGLSVRYIASPKRVWALDRSAGLRSTLDGRTWRAHLLAYTYAPGVLSSALGGGAALASIGEAVFATSNFGRTWNPRSTLDDVALSDSTVIVDVSRPSRLKVFADQSGDRIWAERGDDVFESSDGGASWSAVADLKSLVRMQFFPGGSGVAVSQGGGVFSTADGATWTERNRHYPSDAQIQAAYFLDPRRGWVVDSNGSVRRTEDGGDSWSPGSQEPGTLFRGIHFVDPGLGWVVGEAGAVFSISDSGSSWTRQRSGVDAFLNDVYFMDAQHGFSVGDAGTLIASADGGVTWSKRVLPAGPDLRASPSTADLQDVEFADDRIHGWIAGPGSLLWHTSDGGATWEIVEASRWPAPWYFVACLIAVALAIPLARSVVELGSQQQSIADMLASDRPVGSRDRDVLGFRQIARGISRFLRNAQTELPLTIAITGEWGSGKSSLMTLLRDDLASYGFRPVWFNAWHHQQGEHLLASLFANIRSQALPRVTSRAGIRFRAQLLWGRTWASWVPLLIALPVAACATALLVHQWGHWSDIIRMLRVDEPLGDPDSILAGHLLPVLKSLGIVSPALVAVVLPLWRGMRAFGLDPAKLRNAFSTESERSATPIEPGARFRFAREFDEVTRALRPRAMGIFIDDLDRCSKEHVVEVLEAVNFLVTSGRCFVVLGMARDWVETCVGLAFHDLAEAPAGATDTPLSNAERQRNFARLYLQKLINIEVPVPRVDELESRAMLAPATIDAALDAERNWPRLALDVMKPSAVLALAAMGFWLGTRLDPSSGTPTPAPTLPQDRGQLVISNVPFGPAALDLTLPVRSRGSDASAAPSRGEGLVIGQIPLGDTTADLLLQSSATPASGAPSTDGESVVLGPFPIADGRASLSLRLPVPTANSAGSPPPAKVVASDASRASPTTYYAAQSDSGWNRAWWALPLLVGGGILASLAFALIRRPNVVVRDSPTFIQALDIWHPWIVSAKQTPRTLKRFLNRTRYVAMRLRPDDDEPRWRWPWSRRDGSAASATRDSTPSMPEPALVALASIHHVKPELLSSYEAFAALPVAQSQEARDPLADAIGRHRKKFPGQWPSAQDLALFLDVMQDVRSA